MLVDLNMSRGMAYNLVNLCFFITYVLCQPFMIIICRKVGPKYFLPGICIAWGAVIIGFGFTNAWGGLVPLRLVLGLLESGYFPGCLYLLSCWYTKCASPISDFTRGRNWGRKVANDMQSKLLNDTAYFTSLEVLLLRCLES